MYPIASQGQVEILVDSMPLVRCSMVHLEVLNIWASVIINLSSNMILWPACHRSGRLLIGPEEVNKINFFVRIQTVVFFVRFSAASRPQGHSRFIMNFTSKPEKK